MLGTTAFLVVDVVVVVVVGTGFSTTVVHELKHRATASSGVIIISFFIVEVVSFHKRFGADASTRCISGEDFPTLFLLVVDPGSQFLRPRPLTLRFQDALLQSTRAGRTLPAQLLAPGNFSATPRVPAAFESFR